MRRSLAQFSALESSVRTRYSADFIITTPGSRFSVHTGVLRSTLVHRGGEISLLLCRFASRSTVDEPTAHDVCRVSVSLPEIGFWARSTPWVFLGGGGGGLRGL